MLLSKEFLREKARKRQSTFAHSAIINENAYLASHYDSKEGKTYDVFLSHSSLDHDLVLELVDLFNKAGYSVYVDWIEDQELDRSKVSKDTAKLLRERMDKSRSLAYVSTSNIVNSKWCPWELGYFDGKKDERCCILPIMEGTRFVGQEYLGLYPYLTYSKIEGKDEYEFWVHEQNSTKYVRLRMWLMGTAPYEHK